MFEAIRSTTVHPAFVHFSIGLLPVVVLGYAVGWLKKSRGWTLAGDVSLVTAAALSIVTGVSGLVANSVLAWPAGLGTWRSVHLVGGLLSLALLLGFAAVRLLARRRGEIAGVRSVGLALGVSLVVLATGYVGGEMLVFHSGMAVAGAANGLLSPPVRAGSGQPSDLHEAMEELRPEWAAVTLGMARMLVESPDGETRERVVRAGRRIEKVASWMASEGGETATRPPRAEKAGAPALPVSYADQHGGEGHPATKQATIREMSQELASHASELARQASSGSLHPAVRAARDLEASCMRCHETLRWSGLEMH